ncbi:unnamed protein product, partial [Auanema sp. JU1783]
MNTLFLLLFPSLVLGEQWTRIKLPVRVWSSLAIQSDGQRVLNCGNFDQNSTSRYHWRFNGSSVLPVETQIHKQNLIFTANANADRLAVHGTYDCCVHEILGKACYSQFLNVTDRPKQEGVDLTENDVLYGREGDSYYIRLFRRNKRIDAVHCIKLPDLDHVSANVKYPVFRSKETKQANPYHVRIEKMAVHNLHKYNCTIRFNKKFHEFKIFEAKLLTEITSSTANLLL